jgi:hypothetical protein
VKWLTGAKHADLEDMLCTYIGQVNARIATDTVEVGRNK